MATIQEAVQNAMSFARETLGPRRTEGLQLEEVESGHANGTDAWLITLSMSSSGLAAFGLVKRDYKTFSVLKSSGEVTSMKIRELAET